jgi:hypothetical protein
LARTSLPAPASILGSQDEVLLMKRCGPLRNRVIPLRNYTWNGGKYVHHISRMPTLARVLRAAINPPPERDQPPRKKKR